MNNREPYVVKSLLWMALAVSTLVCCAPKELSQEEADGQLRTVTFVSKLGSEGESATKTTISDKSVLWAEGDEIFIVSNTGNGVAHNFCLSSGAGTKTGSFTGDIESGTSYNAIYTGSTASTPSYSDGVFHCNLAADQTLYATSNSASVMVARASNSDKTFAFKNALGILRFYIESSDVVKVSFAAKGGESLAGDLAISFDGTSVTGVTVSNGSSEVFFGDGNDPLSQGYHYMAIAPGTLSQGFTTTTYKSDGSTIVKEYDNAATIASNRIQDVGYQPARYEIGHSTSSRAIPSAWRAGDNTTMFIACNDNGLFSADLIYYLNVVADDTAASGLNIGGESDVTDLVIDLADNFPSGSSWSVTHGGDHLSYNGVQAAIISRWVYNSAHGTESAGNLQYNEAAKAEFARGGVEFYLKGSCKKGGKSAILTFGGNDVLRVVIEPNKFSWNNYSTGKEAYWRNDELYIPITSTGDFRDHPADNSAAVSIANYFNVVHNWQNNWNCNIDDSSLEGNWNNGASNMLLIFTEDNAALNNGLTTPGERQLAYNGVNTLALGGGDIYFTIQNAANILSFAQNDISFYVGLKVKKNGEEIRATFNGKKSIKVHFYNPDTALADFNLNPNGIKFPIMGYGVPRNNRQAYFDMAECGFTLAIPERIYLESHIQNSRGTGVKLICFVFTEKSTDNDDVVVRDWDRQFMNTYKNDEQVAMWEFCDEPITVDDSWNVQKLRNAVAQIRSIDSSHPIFLNWGAVQNNQYWDSSLSEFYSFDHYPIKYFETELRSSNWYYDTYFGRTWTRWVNDNVEACRLAYQNNTYWNGMAASIRFSGIVPEVRESDLRLAQFGNLACGAQMVSYYRYMNFYEDDMVTLQPYERGTYKDKWGVSHQDPAGEQHGAPVNSDNTKNPSWQMVKNVNDEINSLAGLFTGMRVETASVLNSDWNGNTKDGVAALASFNNFPSNLTISVPSSERILISRFTNGGHTYLMCLNYWWNLTVHPTITIGNGVVRVFSDTNAATAAPGTSTVDLAPGEYLIYRVS